MVGYNSGWNIEGEKAGYNQAGKIIEVLGVLRQTFIGAKMTHKFSEALEAIRSIIDVISGKVPDKDLEEINELVYTIEDKIPEAEAIFQREGKLFIKNPTLRRQIKRDLENIYRRLERMQDKYGYGMVGQDDPRFAVLKR